MNPVFRELTSALAIAAEVVLPGDADPPFFAAAMMNWAPVGMSVLVS